MNFARKYRLVKIAGVSLVLALAAVLGITVFLSRHYRQVMQDKLPAMAAKATDSLYLITAGNLRVNIFGRSVSIYNLRIRPDSAVLARRRAECRLPPLLVDITIPELEIGGLRLSKFAAEQEIVCHTADVYHPTVSVTLTDTALRDHTPKAAPKPAVERILIRALGIHDPRISLRFRESEGTVMQARGGEIAMSNWELVPGQPADTSRFFYAAEARIRLSRIACRKPGALYALDADTLVFASREHELTLKGLSVKPALSKEAFNERMQVRKAIYEASLPVVKIHQLRWESLLSKKALEAGSIELDDPDLGIYLNRLYPPNTASKMGRYPHQLLRKIPFPVDIPLLLIYSGNFHYTEVNEKSNRPGTLDFISISGLGTHITNRPEAAAAQEHCRFLFAGKFMRKSSMGIVFDFPLNAPHGEFSVRGRLMEMDGHQVNEAAKALALAEVKSLQVHRMDFDISGNDSAADGATTIRYNDLKLKIKKVDQATQRLRNRGFVSFVANELLLYNDNPMEGEPVRVAYTHVVRDSTKSFFGLIWRSLYDAGLQTAVRQEGITDMVNKRKANIGKEKVHFFRQLFPKRKRPLRP